MARVCSVVVYAGRLQLFKPGVPSGPTAEKVIAEQDVPDAPAEGVEDAKTPAHVIEGEATHHLMCALRCWAAHELQAHELQPEGQGCRSDKSQC
jgi:hypothetical protein